jgi:hypothetical protein
VVYTDHSLARVITVVVQGRDQAGREKQQRKKQGDCASIAFPDFIAMIRAKHGRIVTHAYSYRNKIAIKLNKGWRNQNPTAVFANLHSACRDDIRNQSGV